jgi:hypothetical protein
MKYKILMYDGHPVDQVLDTRVVYRDLHPPRLLPQETTIDSLVKQIIYKSPWKENCEKLLRTCDLEEVELRFTKEI